MDFEILPFNKGYRRDEFDCGNDELNDWLRTRAGQQERRHNTRTFLAIRDGRIIAYYASTTYQLDIDEAAAAFGSGSRRYPMPAILLARLAVDRASSGHNVGRRLVLHFLREMARLSHSVGLRWFWYTPSIETPPPSMRVAAFYPLRITRTSCSSPPAIYVAPFT